MRILSVERIAQPGVGRTKIANNGGAAVDNWAYPHVLPL